MSRPAGRDDGFSYLEILVAMTVFVVIGAVFTTGVVQLYRTAGAADAEYTAESQASLALLRLEKQIRYAYSIGTVHNEGAAATPYLEYLVMAPASAGSTSLVKRCVQVRMAGSAPAMQLQSRYWTAGAPAGVTGWATLASGLSAGAAPFVRTEPTSAVNHQLLTVSLAARSGAAIRSSSITFTALNTYAGTVLDSSGNPLPATSEPCYDSSLRS